MDALIEVTLNIKLLLLFNYSILNCNTKFLLKKIYIYINIYNWN